MTRCGSENWGAEDRGTRPHPEQATQSRSGRPQTKYKSLGPSIRILVLEMPGMDSGVCIPLGPIEGEGVLRQRAWTIGIY